MARLFSRVDQPKLDDWRWSIDRGMLICATVFIVTGILLVAAASPAVAERIGIDQFYFLKRHVIILIPSVCLMIGISFLSPRNIWRLLSLVFIGSIIAMLMVLAFGDEIKGAKRWIRIFGFSLQPSEFAKMSFAVVGAWVMYLKKEKLHFHGYKVLTGLYLLVVGLMLLQPDFGMTMVTSVIFGVHIFLSGCPIWVVAALFVGGLVMVLSAYFIFDHVQSRIDRFLNPDSGDSYQIEKSLEAIKEGGLFGTGPGQGTVKLQLPDGHADFIFAVAGEELGLIFLLPFIALFLYMILRGLNKIMNEDDVFIVLAVAGILVMYAMQAFVHMGSALHILPAKGMTLPFISYGGSSLLSSCIAMGVVLGLTRRQVRQSIARGGSITKRGR